MSDLGRQVKYGIGKETVAGTPVSATYWLNQLSFDLNPKVDHATNDAAFGVIEKVNDSTVTHQWAEGTLSGKLTADTTGMVLLGTFGSVSNATNSDVSGIVYDHTFTINQSTVGQTFTLVRKDSTDTLAYPLARFGEWQLKMTLKDYVQFSAAVMAKKGASASASVAYGTNPIEFVAKHATVKTASTVSGLSGATAISALESFTLKVDPNLQADFQAGSSDPYSFSSTGYEFSFEMECRYNDTTFRDAYNNNTSLALQVAISNTDVTIGTSAHPGLVLTAPKMIITDWARTEDMDKPITQKMTGTIHYSAPDAYALKAVLTDTVATF